MVCILVPKLKACSFFGRQEGEFTLGVVSIAALRMERYLDDPDGEKIPVLDEKRNALDSKENGSWLEWLAGCARLFWCTKTVGLVQMKINLLERHSEHEA